MYEKHRHYFGDARRLGRETLVEEGEAFARFSRLGSSPTPSPEPLLAEEAPRPISSTERVEVVVIGAGQAGLSVGYHLSRRGIPFVILNADARVGDSWRRRWDSLRLFTPARFDGLDGMPFPAAPNYFPTKDEMADYLEAYAAKFALPVRHGVLVDGLTRDGDRYRVTAGDRAFEARHVVVAMASYQKPRVPALAKDLAPEIVQLHSSAYRNLGDLADGPVLVVGAGNSGAEIALETARGGHRTWMAGRDVGHVPFDIAGLPARAGLLRLVLRFLFHRVLSVGTPMGRRLRPKMISQGGPLIRQKPKHLDGAGIERVPRVAAVRDGRPVLADGRVLEPANVVWCTGFHPGFDWIHRPVFDGKGEPIQMRGVAAGEPGLYFVGLHFLYALSSTMIHGVGRDAERVAGTIAKRRRAVRSERESRPALVTA